MAPTHPPHPVPAPQRRPTWATVRAPSIAQALMVRSVTPWQWQMSMASDRLGSGAEGASVRGRRPSVRVQVSSMLKTTFNIPSAPRPPILGNL